MPSSNPHFAVVGHPNKGKSSIVATLAQDDSVYIDRISGSTTECRYFPMTVNNEELYVLVDTPGFQRARAVLQWLQNYCDDTSKRPQAIKQFYQSHQNDPRYHNECQLLKPLLEGAGIIYVVDGSRPYGPEYEAEMEILRWTGQPSLALINPIDNSDYVSEWESALGQYFKTVRVFDAHRAEFIKHTALLKVFGQLLPQWEQAIGRAIDVLLKERERIHLTVSDQLATLVSDSISYTQSQKIPGNTIPESVKTLLSQQYQQHLRQLENRSRLHIQETYAYFQLDRQEDALEINDTDLFDVKAWYLTGLSKQQLVTAAAGAGAGAGALIDIGLAGHSLLMGSVIGAVSGGAGAWLFSKKIGQVTVKGLPTGGNEIQIGPASDPNFAFVVLGRALHHLRLLTTRTHAVRQDIEINESSRDGKALDFYSLKEKSELLALFKAISQNKKVFEHRNKMAKIIQRYVAFLDGDV